MPTDVLEQRLGWAPVKGEAAKWETLEWLKEVTTEIWGYRYENEKRKLLKKDKKEKEKENDQEGEAKEWDEEEDSESEDDVASGDE